MRNLSLVEGNDRGKEADTDASKEAARPKERQILGSSLEDSAENKNGTADDDGPATTDIVCGGGGAKGAEERASCKQRDDCTAGSVLERIGMRRRVGSAYV